MKYLIVGLGNIGTEYEGTRHNIGFDAVDLLARNNMGEWKACSFGAMATIRHKGRRIMLLKPDTYMNRSGRAVQYWMEKEKVPIEKVLIVVDDLNLPFGKIRLRAKGSDGGHNGLEDITRYLGQSFPRVRLGIGDDFKRGKQIDFVLGKWDAEEQLQLKDILDKTEKLVLSFCAIGLSHTMNLFNN